MKFMTVKTLYKIFLATIFAVSSGAGLVLASQSSGTILSNTYSTSAVCSDSGCTTPGLHRINWKPTVINNITPVTIVDGVGVRGQVWGEKLGWVNFSITPVNNIVPTSINVNTGAVTGYAWASNSGWINFSPTTVNNISGVTINGSGEFTGTAWVSGINGGFMKFDCSGGATTTCVKTDWVPVPFRTTTVIGGGGGGGGVVICSDSKATNYLQPGGCTYSSIFQQQVNDGEKLIGGINPDGGTEFEPNVPKEFAPYVCKRYLRDYIYDGNDNKPEEVKKLQSFLNDKESAGLTESGIYDAKTKSAVMKFQEKYKDEILGPWGFEKPTGYVGRTTVIKINLLSCAEARGCPYFKTYMKEGDAGLEAVRIQDFLNIINAPTNGYPTNGISLSKEFARPTFNSVAEFQNYYKKTVLEPWGLKQGTGWWYQTTRYAANKLMNCAEGEIELDNGKKHKW